MPETRARTTNEELAIAGAWALTWALLTAADGVSEAELVRVAAAVEASTRHPLADAITETARQRGACVSSHIAYRQRHMSAPHNCELATFLHMHSAVSSCLVTLWCTFEGRVTSLIAGIEVPALHEAFTEPGAGVRGTLDGRRVAVGQLHWVQAATAGAHSSGQGSTPAGHSFEDGVAGQTVVYCGVEGQGVIGALAFSDSLRCAVVGRLTAYVAPSFVCSPSVSSHAGLFVSVILSFVSSAPGILIGIFPPRQHSSFQALILVVRCGAGLTRSRWCSGSESSACGS